MLSIVAAAFMLGVLAGYAFAIFESSRKLSNAIAYHVPSKRFFAVKDCLFGKRRPGIENNTISNTQGSGIECK